MICWFYFRNAHFSCSLWPRLRPVGSQGIAKFLILVLLFQGHLQRVWQHQIFAGAWHDEVPPLPPRAEGVRRCHQHWSAQHPLEDQVFEISYIFWLLSSASTKCCQYLHCTFRKTSEKAPYKGPKSALQIFGFKMTPPLWNFSENSSDLVAWPIP